jgi:NAD(P)-dependent dehydrogenase (short-subunit alcohol dehydrogenase family)
MQSIMNLLQPPPSTYEPLDESGKLRKTSISGRAFIVTGKYLTPPRGLCRAQLLTRADRDCAGAASGIGRATALMLAQQGCRLALTDRDTAGGRTVCEEIKELGKVDVVFATLEITSKPRHSLSYPSHNSEVLALTHSRFATDDTDVGKLVRTFHKTYKKIDGLVNCAGQSRPSSQAVSLAHRKLTVCAFMRLHSLAGINLPLPLTHETPLDKFKLTLDVNLQGTFSMCTHYLKEVLSPNNQNEAPAGGWAIV